MATTTTTKKGVEDPAEWAHEYGNMWRTTLDIYNSWYGVLPGLLGVTQIIDITPPYGGGPGGWNDMDMLEVGNGVLTEAEERSHFSLWALMKSPLLIGCDLTKIPQSSLDILKAPEIIAVNQDSTLAPARRVASYPSDRDASLLSEQLELGDEQKMQERKNQQDSRIAHAEPPAISLFDFNAMTHYCNKDGKPSGLHEILISSDGSLRLRKKQGILDMCLGINHCNTEDGAKVIWTPCPDLIPPQTGVCWGLSHWWNILSVDEAVAQNIITLEAAQNAAMTRWKQIDKTTITEVVNRILFEFFFLN